MSSSIDAGVITPEVPNTPPPSPSSAADAKDVMIETVAVAIVGKNVLPDCLVAVIDKAVADITDVPEVSEILRHVPKFISAVHTLADKPGAEKRTLVLQGLHALAEKLQDANKISAEFRAQLDAFVDATVPVSIDAVLDIVKGRVTFESLAQKVIADPVVVSTALTCCLGFLKTLSKKKAVAAVGAPAETVAEPKAA